MADFKVEVPITLKGGNEGAKVGTQIGEKIASQLNKSLRAIGIGKTTGASPVGMSGVTKGLGSVATKLAVVGTAIVAAVGLLAKSSPYLKGILDIFGRAFLIFFRPFGDFLATLLRPLALLMMKMAVAFLKWTRPITTKIKEVTAGVPQIPETGLVLPDIATGIGNWFIKLGAVFAAGIHMIGKGLVQLGYDIAEWIHTKVIIPAGEFLAAKLFGIWDWTKNFPKWIWDQITSIWVWGTKDFGSWIWDQITSIWTWTWDFGAWIKQKIINALDPTPGNILSKWILGDGQVGIPNVQKDGLYQLHRGESVVSRSKTGQSTILNPTFNFTGNISSEIDIDELMRRANRMNEMELKQRGVI